MKTIRFLLPLVFMAGVASAQRDAEPSYFTWAPVDILNLHDSVAVYLTADEINTPYSDQSSIAVINSKGVETGPEVPLPKFVLGMARFNGNIIAFYQPEKKNEQRELHAVLIDLVHRKVLSDKQVYAVPGMYTTQFIIERDPEGNFQGLVARVSGLKEKLQVLDMEAALNDAHYVATTSLSLTTLSPDLQPTMVPLNSVAVQGAFVTSAINRAGELFLVSQANGEMVAEKFSASGSLATKISEAFQPRSKSHMTVVGSLDKATDNAIIVAVKYKKEDKDEAEAAFEFDFTSGKAYGGKEDILNKDYYRYLKADTSQATKIKSSNIKFIERLVPISIVETRDYIAICKEIEYVISTGSGSSYVNHYWCDAAILTVYDHQMNLVRSITLDKTLETFVESYPGIDIHLDGDKLYAITAEVAGVASLAEYSYSIDLKTGAQDKKKLRKAYWGRAAVTRPEYTFWIKDGFVMNYELSRGLTGRKVKTYFLPGAFE
jgi:hypothetical protein